MNRWIRTTARGAAVIAVALLLPALPGNSLAAAAPDLAGVWEGKLAVDASTSLTVQFNFTAGANGTYTAVLNSPDNPALKDAATSNLSWDGTNLKLQVPSLSGSYAGVLKGGKLDGQWTQPGGALPLVLSPYRKPVVTAAAARSISGGWHGELKVGAITQNLAFQFKQGAGGGLEATFGIPDQGLNGLPASSVVLENGELSLKVQVGPQLLDYKGKLEGDQVTGTLKAAGLPAEGVPVTLKRGEYKVVAPPLKLSADDFAKVKGRWQGVMDVPVPPQAQAAAGAAGAGQTPGTVKVTVVMRFETSEKGEYIGYLAALDPGQTYKSDSPGFAIGEAQFADGKLTVKVPITASIEYNATVSGNDMNGTWIQSTLGRSISLALKKQ